LLQRLTQAREHSQLPLGRLWIATIDRAKTTITFRLLGAPAEGFHVSYSDYHAALRELVRAQRLRIQFLTTEQWEFRLLPHPDSGGTPKNLSKRDT
jgi:hypothetical protein